jgi:hypothetical protein
VSELASSKTEGFNLGFQKLEAEGFANSMIPLISFVAQMKTKLKPRVSEENFRRSKETNDKSKTFITNWIKKTFGSN